VYLHNDCPYIEPIDINITTNSVGGLDANNTFKAVTALRYYKKETVRLKVFINEHSHNNK
jgi:hypothetical protein